MIQLFIKFFPVKSTLCHQFLTVVLAYLTGEFSISYFCMSVVGVGTLFFYYGVINFQVSNAICEKLVLDFISARPYAQDSDSKREEIWDSLAQNANKTVEERFHVKDLLSAKDVENRLNNILDSPYGDSKVPEWQRVKLAAKNIRAEDLEAFWSRKIPGVLERYATLSEQDLLSVSVPDKV